VAKKGEIGKNTQLSDFCVYCASEKGKVVGASKKMESAGTGLLANL